MGSCSTLVYNSELFGGSCFDCRRAFYGVFPSTTHCNHFILFLNSSSCTVSGKTIFLKQDYLKKLLSRTLLRTPPKKIVKKMQEIYALWVIYQEAFVRNITIKGIPVLLPGALARRTCPAYLSGGCRMPGECGDDSIGGKGGGRKKTRRFLYQSTLKHPKKEERK